MSNKSRELAKISEDIETYNKAIDVLQKAQDHLRIAKSKLEIANKDLKKSYSGNEEMEKKMQEYIDSIDILSEDLRKSKKLTPEEKGLERKKELAQIIRLCEAKIERLRQRYDEVLHW